MTPYNTTPFRRAALVTVLAAGACLAAVAQESPPASPLPEAPMRAWTSVNGNVIEGSFVKEENGRIFLKRNGSIVATTRQALMNDFLD